MESKTLYRSTTDRKIAGVCGGVAAHFGWDPTGVRVAWILVALLAGTGFLLYLVLWIVLPEAPTTGTTSSAVTIAEERYARGEITADELRRIKEDLST
jgi:phage shock protein PspC (stress-responsive transcriptional regulator)